MAELQEHVVRLKTGSGPVQAVPQLRVARSGAMKARTVAEASDPLLCLLCSAGPASEAVSPGGYRV